MDQPGESARIYVFPADKGACGHYRVRWPALALQAQGHDVHVIEDAHHQRKLLTLPNALSNAGVTHIVLQRVTNPHLAATIPRFQAEGIKVIIDMDDDLSCIHPNNPAFIALHPRAGTGYNWQVADEACAMADVVTVSTPPLIQKYAPHGRGVVLPNCVPQRYLELPSPIDRPPFDLSFGWAGSLASHPGDMDVLGSAVSRLHDDGYKFTIVGPDKGITKALSLPHTWNSATGLVSIENWGAALAANLHVGLAPLTDNKFNRSKSYLKGLEYAACGVVPVMSPLPEYTKLYDMGIGVLCNKPKDWIKTIKKLLEDTDYRMQKSKEGREIAAAMTIEGNTHSWLNAWTSELP